MEKISKRRKASEDEFMRDEAIQFRINARRDWLLGIWAAEKMYYDDNQALEYANDLVTTKFSHIGHEPVASRVLKEMQRTGIDITEEDVANQAEKFLDEATNEVYIDASRLDE